MYPESTMPLPRAQQKRLSVFNQFGGACQRCGYDKCIRALHFHHTDGSEKRDWSGSRGNASPEEVLAHPERFILLCANCHAEEHARLVEGARVYVYCGACGKPMLKHYKRDSGLKGKYCSRKCQHVVRKAESLTLAARTTRFWKYVEKTDDCWLWVGVVDKRMGHGILAFSDENNERHAVVASRFSYELHIGPIPPDTYVLQTCRNKLCVRPDHFFLQHKGRMPTRGWDRPNTTQLSLIY